MSRATFSAVRSEGGLLPADLLVRVSAGEKKLAATDPESYELLAHETLGEAVNRAWSRLVGAWRAFREATTALPEHDRGTTLTRERWLFPLFQELGYGRLTPARAVEIDGRAFAVSHGWQHAPIHLVSFRFELDKRLPGVSGAASSSPHGLLQDLLNRSDAHLWGFVSNGLVLRVLRDHHSLTRKAFLEFDLEQIFDGELYSEFRLLWLVCHQSRVQADKPDGCVLEQWFAAVKDEGVQALDKLREGVETALKTLGSGLVAHPANTSLREALASGQLSTMDLYRQLLRLAYQLIFVFVAEDRGVLLDPDAPREARERYTKYYSTRRIRDLADKKRGGAHGDLWRQLQLVLSSLYEGCPALALPAYGSFLWSPESTAKFTGCQLANEHLLAALRALDSVEEGGVRRPVAWNLVSADELGGIYESLMELHPVVHAEATREPFDLDTAPGHERKTTGSYYTPTSLVECLLDSALDPVLDEATRNADPEVAILDLKVVDPACGSGHFLVAAARRIAERLARVRTGDAEPAPRDYQKALRDVVGRCIYGVDLNEMAVELCKVALWMEAIEPGKPLSFLDAHIQCGNALLGTTPKLIEGGIPDDAWKAITGDDKEVAKALKARNRRERKGEIDWTAPHFVHYREPEYDTFSGQLLALEGARDDSLQAVRAKESAWRRLRTSPRLKDATFLADLWCSAFVWKKDRAHGDAAPTQEVFRRVAEDAASCPSDTRKEVKRLAREYRFFHWHLAFPAAFTPERGEASEETGWHGGFDVVLGNPPWDVQEVKDIEFFASTYPELLSVKSAKDKAKILQQIKTQEPQLWWRYAAYQRASLAQRSFLSGSGRFRLGASGRLNLYRLFLDLSCQAIHSSGWLGTIIPSGFTSDAFSQQHFRSLHESGQLRMAYDFINSRPQFQGIHRSYRFTLLAVGPARRNTTVDFTNFCVELSDLADPTRHVLLSASDLALINPTTRTAPQFLNTRNYQLTLHAHRQGTIIGSTGSAEWRISSSLMFMMNAAMDCHRTLEEISAEPKERDTAILHSLDGRSWVRLFEGKMVGMYDHRASDVIFNSSNRARRNQAVEIDEEEHKDPTRISMPMFWVPEEEVRRRVGGRHDWLLAVKDVTSATNERTCIGAILPWSGLSDGLPWLRSETRPDLLHALLANLNAIFLDFIARQKVAGLHLRGHYLAGYSSSTP